MKLYYSPGSCAQAPHIALHELDLPFEGVKVDLDEAHAPDGSDYYAVNKKGYVPFLVLDDGTTISEASVILQYIADQKPGHARTGLRHEGALEAHGVAGVHLDGNSQGVRPAVESARASADVRERAVQALEQSLQAGIGNAVEAAIPDGRQVHGRRCVPVRRSRTGRAITRSTSPRGPRCSSSRRALRPARPCRRP